MKHLFLSLSFFLLLAFNGICESEFSPHFHNLTVRDGLPNDWIKSITQDKQGFMWFATNDGLCKYDGANFTSYRSDQENLNSLSSNIINCVYSDIEGNIWIGTNRGVNYYSVIEDEIHRIDDYSHNITSILELNKDQIIFSSHNGILIYEKSTGFVEFFTLAASGKANSRYPIRTMLLYENQILLFSSGGCYSFDNETKKFSLLIEDTDIFKGNDVRSSFVHNNELWIGVLDKGLLYTNLDSLNYPKYYHTEFTDNQTIYSLSKTNRNELAIGCENNGLVFLDLAKTNLRSPIKNIKNLNNLPFGLVNNSIHSIFEDHQENLWIGTYNGISYQYNDGKGFSSLVVNANNINAISNDMVNSILETSGMLWVGTENGIDIFDANMKKVKSIKANNGSKNSLLSEAIMALEVDDYGNIWAGSWTGGIDILNAQGDIIKQIVKGDNDQCISHSSVLTIKRDKNGNMWVGSNGGGIDIYSKSKKSFIRIKEKVNYPKSLSNNWVLSFLVTSKNEIWVSTHDGLCLFDPLTSQFITYRHKKNNTSIASNVIDCMLEDNNGALWFGSTFGLSRFNRVDSTFTNYYESDGLTNNYVKSILCDKKNQLWIGTNAGLSKLSFDDEYTNPEFINYYISDGLIANEFIRRACFEKNNGELVFGTKEGLVYFDPTHILNNPVIPEVYLTSLYVNNKVISVNDETDILNKNIRFNPNIKLKYDQSNLSFSFSALNYVAPDKNQYQYKMHGFDDEWISIGNETKATYTNIPYGQYEFQVTASNNSGVWNNEGAKLKIHITPPWYRTKISYVLYFIIVLLLILSYRFFIVKQTMLESKLKLEIIEKENLNRVNQMKTKFFTNISHEFLTPLSLILSPLETISNDTELTHDKLQNKISPIYRNAKRLQRLINQLLDISKINADHLALNVSPGNIYTFVYDIHVGFKSLANQKNIQFNFQSSLKDNLIYFDADKIEKIIYNLLSNAIKFTSEKGQVTLSLNIYDNQLNIRVEDTGIGIDDVEKKLVFDSFYQSKHAKNSNYLGTGVGLNLVNGLVNVYGGSISLESELNQGSCFSIKLPYRKIDFANNAISENSRELEPKIDIEEVLGIEEPQLKDETIDESLPTLLLVEDNMELNAHIVALLSTKFNVTSAFDGEQGVNLANKTIPDIIIADWLMPKMSGMALLKSLRENEPTSHIPVIILTAKIDDDSKIIGIENGADAYITKPFEHKHLFSTIKNLLESRKKLKDIYKKSIVIEPTQVQITSIDEKFVKKAIKIVEDNLQNSEFTVEIMAQEIGMSRAQLHRKVKGLLGMPTSAFIRDIKIKKAADLMTIGQLRVSEAMFEVNIKSRNYFTKCFKEKYAMQPTEYVKQYKKKHRAC